jgi:hypothetical protein
MRVVARASYLVVDRFAAETAALRATFDTRFADPRGTRGDRFVWDWWHVPGQYTHLRTPAWQYFPRALYALFHNRLVAWGREVLGCHDVSPPWLSLYVDGCGQELHGDLPHGPWAFVFSLTRWRGRTFRGGETLLLRDDLLDYWHDFRSTRALEQHELVHAIEPQLGRLVVFDPRVPHGVRAVTGTRDPREGRLVIHGWFVQPRPFVRGPLAVRALSSRLAELGDAIAGWLDDLAIAGTLALAFAVDRGGRGRRVRVRTDTTRAVRADEPRRRRFVARVRAEIAAWTFGVQRGASHVTLPLVFER